MSSADWPIVIVESPFRGFGETWDKALYEQHVNLAYAKRACLDCLSRKEVPFASHVFFTSFLDDAAPEQREQGLTAGYAFWNSAAKIVFYIDRGWSSGMERAHHRNRIINKPIEFRSFEFNSMLPAHVELLRLEYAVIQEKAKALQCT